MSRFWCGLILLCSIISCNKTADTVSKPVTSSGEAFTEYIIPKGQHATTASVARLVRTKELKFMALFDSSCIYTTRNVANAGDINKLYGFSDCRSHHQTNSARVGWVWNGQVIELYAYCYVDGRRVSKLLDTVAIDEEVRLGISVRPGKYVFSVREKADTIARGCDADEAEGYQLYPYFGGDETAPHEVRVFIREI